MARQPLALLLLAAHAPGQEARERELGDRERHEQRQQDGQERLPDAVAGVVDAVRWVVRLHEHALAIGERQGHVHLDQPPAAAALQPVLRPRQIAHLGAHRVVGQRLSQVGGQREVLADQLAGVGVDDLASRGPDLDPQDRVAQHAIANRAIQGGQRGRLAVQDAGGDAVADRRFADRHGELARVAQRLAGGHVTERERAGRGDDDEQREAAQRELGDGHAATAEGAPPRSPLLPRRGGRHRGRAHVPQRADLADHVGTLCVAMGGRTPFGKSAGPASAENRLPGKRLLARRASD